jgi:hypothetical protein
MTFSSVHGEAYESSKWLGIAVGQPQFDGQRHVGIIYRHDTTQMKFCHFLWHHLLRTADSPPRADYVWDRCWSVDDDEFNAKFLVGYIKSIKEGQKVPFGFSNDARIFADDGTYIEMEIGRGLTCASFVMHVFEQSGIKLIQTETWQKRADDIEWQKCIVSKLREDKYFDHAEAAAKYIGSFRFRPEEVAVAAANVSPPIAFDQAISLAKEIIAELAAIQSPKSAATDIDRRWHTCPPKNEVAISAFLCSTLTGIAGKIPSHPNLFLRAEARRLRKLSRKISLQGVLNNFPPLL